eukprot:2155705-Rhodomonas_salina.3
MGQRVSPESETETETETKPEPDAHTHLSLVHSHSDGVLLRLRPQLLVAHPHRKLDLSPPRSVPQYQHRKNAISRCSFQEGRGLKLAVMTGHPAGSTGQSAAKSDAVNHSSGTKCTGSVLARI